MPCPPERDRSSLSLQQTEPLPHFNLVTLDGDSLGAVELAVRDWPPGAVIDPGGTERKLRVLGQLTGTERARDPEVLAILVVQEI